MCCLMSMEAWQAFVEEKQKMWKNFSSTSKGLQAGPADTLKPFSYLNSDTFFL